MKSSKVLVLSLAVRGGGLVYSREIIHRLNLDKYVISARNTKVQRTMSNEYWTVHTNRNDFFLYSFLIFPIYFFKILLGLVQKKYDKLYLPNFHFWNVAFILLFRVFRKDIILTVHDGTLRTKNPVLFIRFIQMLENLTIRFSTVLIFLSRHVKISTSKTIKIDKKISYVIPHGIIRPIGLKNINRQFNDTPTILFFGRVLKSKGVDELIEAVSMIDKRRYNKLLIIGKQTYRPVIWNNMNIEIIDEFVPEEEIAYYFNKADILVLPYQEASQSGVLTIGIGAAIPMVVTRGSGLSEQLEEGECIFVDKDPKSIKEGILQLIENPLRYNQISKALYMKQNKLTWENIVSEIESVIKSL